MDIPPSSITHQQSPPARRMNSARLPKTGLGLPGHIAALLIFGVLAAVAIGPSMDLWPVWAVSLTAAVALLSVRRSQPRIDDREIDLILAFFALASGAWALRQWPEKGAADDTMAWLLCTMACLLVVSGTRAMTWLWPAAIPALVWLLPAPVNVFALVVVAAVGAVGFVLITSKRGLAPPDQLTKLPLARITMLVVVLILTAVAARWGVAA